MSTALEGRAQGLNQGWEGQTQKDSQGERNIRALIESERSTPSLVPFLFFQAGGVFCLSQGRDLC